MAKNLRVTFLSNYKSFPKEVRTLSKLFPLPIILPFGLRCDIIIGRGHLSGIIKLQPSGQRVKKGESWETRKYQGDHRVRGAQKIDFLKLFMKSWAYMSDACIDLTLNNIPRL